MTGFYMKYHTMLKWVSATLTIPFKVTKTDYKKPFIHVGPYFQSVSKITPIRPIKIVEKDMTHIETSPLICSADQRTGFYMIGSSAMKELSSNSTSRPFQCLEKKSADLQSKSI